MKLFEIGYCLNNGGTISVDSICTMLVPGKIRISVESIFFWLYSR
jgi:hypothetical protein